jgi:puromycin-sensitive aminopeptidase
VAEVIAHELAHQWFGNLVTMRWWDDLWLNEAFATWVAYKAVGLWHPDWRMWDDSLESKEAALGADALTNTHPVYTAVSTPAQATELFDLITYEKGSAVLRMTESFLGEARFRAGIQTYIRRFKNGNATGDDLWACLSEHADVPVAALMQDWITQPGFPLLQVELVPGRSHASVRLRQRRMLTGSDGRQEQPAQVWRIPMVLTFGNESSRATVPFLMTEIEQTFALPDSADTRWVFANADAAGFYRLQHTPELLQALLGAGLARLTPAERKSLVDDTWALVRAGLVPIEQFLSVLMATRNDPDYLVVRAIASRLSFINQQLVSPEDRPLWAEFTRDLLKTQLAGLGWDRADNEEPTTAVRRATVIDALGDVGRDPAVLAEAARRLPHEMKKPAEVDPDLAPSIVTLAAIAGDAALLDRYFATYQHRQKKNHAPEVRARYINALPFFEDPRAVASVHRACLDGRVPQEQIRVILMLLLHRHAAQLATWAFMKTEWPALAPQVGAMGIANLVESTGALPFTCEPEVEAFFREHPVPEAQRAVRKALEAMQLRRALYAREGERLGEWLRARRWQASIS